MKAPGCITLLGVWIWQTIASAQSYSIDWHSINGGGGTSAAGVSALSGTVGQPSVLGPLAGGSFSLNSGFWSVVATANAPVLTIHRTNAHSVVVYWPSPSTGFILQQTTMLAPSNWSTPSEAVIDNGTTKFIIVNSPTDSRFFRLVRP